MARIFNRIRKDLLFTQKFRKYLVYAVGEIILVVVGILIALQINNWNEKRKKVNEFRDIVSTIRQDLVLDTTEISLAMEAYAEKRPVYQKVLNGSAGLVVKIMPKC